LTPDLYILLPKDIPLDSKAVQWCEANRLQDLLAAVSSETSNLALVKQLDLTLEFFERRPSSRPVEQKQSDDSAHDSYFRISRLEHDEAAVFARMAVQARLILATELEEPSTPAGREDHRMIDRALADLTAAIAGSSVSHGQAVSEWECRSEHRDPMRRWIRGHQIFAALTQGLIFSFQAMGRSLRSGHQEGTARWADLSIGLLRGSAATFRYTGDFTAEEYRRVVRPSMSPPAAPICLSGLMSVDHRYFVQLMGKMKPALRLLRQREPLRHRQISEGMASVYDSHIYVCERFVGDRPSLLTAGRTEKSGPQLIEHFKSMRLKPFEGAVQAAPVGAAAASSEQCPHTKAQSAALEKARGFAQG